MQRLDNRIMDYAWGSRTALAEMQGRASPSAGPEAELWIGAHPSAPSRLAGHSLAGAIAADPERLLGDEVARRWGRLPFLLKVLAVDTPLSLQAHPSVDQARAGFLREETAGIARDAPHRTYRDDNPKPELLVALTPFTALCGFRDVGAAATFARWMDEPGARPTVEEVLAASEGAPGAALARRLAELYPGDAGAVCSTLMNLVELAPGEGIYLPAGVLHAYVRGVGVEIMASSDNVLRGGLTPKHVDVPELLRVLDLDAAGAPPIVRARGGGDEQIYDTPAPEFRLSRFDLGPGAAVSPARRGPELLLCTRGTIAAGDLTIPSGEAAWVPADDPPYTLAGDGTLWRATAGEV